MPAKVILHEGGDEIIAVVVTRLKPQHQRDAGHFAGRVEQSGTKLFGQELILLALIHQQFRQMRPVFDQRDRVMLAPACRIFAEIARKHLLAAGNLRRRDDGREGGDAAKAIGVAQGDRKRAMSTHSSVP